MGLSRNTVRKWVKAPAEVKPCYQRGQAAGKLSVLEPVLLQMLK
jgi:hypothetical protein